MDCSGSHSGDIVLLITDLVMPEMNGKALADRLRGIVPGLKCLFMSGYSADVVDPPAGLDPDTCFVQKPFSMRELSAKVREAMGQVQEAPGSSSESAF